MLIERLIACMPEQWVAIVVDDDSPDGTSETVRSLAARHNSPGLTKVVLIRRQNEKGLTSALQNGISIARNQLGADLITWMDCDASMPPEDVPRLVSAIIDGPAEIAVGSRWMPGGDDKAHGTLARTLSWLINICARLFLINKIHDYTSGFVAARSEVFQHIKLRGDYGEYCIDFLFRALRSGFVVQEIPYVCVPRIAGESQTGANLWDYLVKGRKYVSTIWRLRKNLK